MMKRSRMNHLLHFRIHVHHASIEIRVIAHQDIRVPCGSDKEGVYPAADWCHEDLADLKSDEEGESQYDGGESASLVVARLGEFEIEVGQESA